MNPHSPVIVRIVKTKKRLFISSSEKTWEGSELPTSLMIWKLCKGRNYKKKMVERFKGASGSELREGGIRRRKDRPYLSRVSALPLQSGKFIQGEMHDPQWDVP